MDESTAGTPPSEETPGKEADSGEAPHSRPSPLRLRVSRCTTGIGGVGDATLGRARSAMTPAGSSGPTLCPSGSR
ncbi:hypothetical protein [Amycolatopsis vancoresmycina]|uniref:hypothetical protein n=1 Tax=Amycolatopsis vancoresmycina TaxID=208444 RepID=UPI001AE0E505|nr:hypothetical protein [Amycolatopsis vancoresmycina]